LKVEQVFFRKSSRNNKVKQVFKNVRVLQSVRILMGIIVGRPVNTTVTVGRFRP